MDLDEKDIELIDRYVKGELSGDTLRGFQQRLATDSAFAEQVGWHETLVGGIKKQSSKELKTYLQSLEEKTISSHIKLESETKIVSHNFWKYASAAVVALLVAAFLWLDPLHPSPEALFAQYYQPYPNVEATIERNNGEADAYTQAFQWYEDGQYEKAALAFDQLLQAGAPSEALYYYAGLTALELHRTKEALQYFDHITENSDHKYYQQALWYAALAALKDEDTARAKNYLQKLSGLQGFYGEKAVQLLEEL
jgi:tetratricopeptide (TPR) repeat protein